MSNKTIKFTPECALYLTTFLKALNVKNLPPAFEFGKKAEKYTLLSNQILGQDDCPFSDAKESTVTGWVKNVFSAVSLLHTHISVIEDIVQLNLEEVHAPIEITNDQGVTTTIELVSAEYDTQKNLGLVLPAALNKSVAAVNACAIKNENDTMDVLSNLIVIREAVVKFRGKESKKLEKEREHKKRKNEAGEALVNPAISLMGTSSDSNESASDEDSEQHEPPAKQAKKAKDKKKAIKDPKKAGKKRKPEGPPLGQGQATGSSALSLAQVINKAIDADIQAATAAAPRAGDPMEIKAWDFLSDVKSYTGDSAELLEKTKTVLSNEGAQGPTDLRLMGKKLLEIMAVDLKGVPAKALRKVKETCSQE